MSTTTDVACEPVSVEVRAAGEEQVHRVTLARGPRGLAVSCTCAMHRAEAWCRHALDVLCMRLRDCGVADEAVALAVEEAVVGAPAEERAHDLDLALLAYARALAAFDERRCAGVGADSLAAMGAMAREVADAAGAVADAARRYARATGGAA